MTTKIPVELSSTPGISDSSNATAITIDSSEQVGIGETSPLGKLHVKTADSGGSADSGADELVLENSGAAGITILSGTSNSGSIRFGDSDDNDNGMLVYNHGSSPYLRLFTGGSVRARLDSDGLKFGSDTAADSALDDYEEGTWTPTSVANIDALTNVQGFYTKIGRMVYCLFHASIDPTSTGSGVNLGGLPFTVQQLVTHSGIQGTNAIFSDSALFLVFPLQGGTTLAIELDRPMQGSASSSSASYRGSFMYATDQ